MSYITEIKNMSKKQEIICDLARELAQKSDMNKSKHGAVVVNGKKIIGMGYNRYCQNKNCYTIHAEVDAIKDALNNYGKNYVNNAQLYVIRISKEDINPTNRKVRKIDPYINNISRTNFRLSKPCLECTNFIIKHNISMVYYSID
jgi:deoxycytidylate deaminase